MSSRPEPRLQANLRVRVWGMGADGHPFFQGAQAHNISNHGALLSGVEHELTPGDVIAVQYNDKKARFRVVWVIDAGQLQKMQVGLQMLEGQECPWPHELKPLEAGSISAAAAPASAANKRRFPRHKISFSLELRDERSTSAHMQTNATDISGRGCYVETIMPLAVDTPLKITFWIDSDKVSTSGIVRACDPGVGMGIEFTGLSLEDQQRLQQHIERLDKGFASTPGPKTEF
jgi:hypothetical protein